MSLKKGFFCELPATVIGKIRRLSKRRDVSQGFIVEHAMNGMPDVPAREKIDHKEVARRGEVRRKDAKEKGQEMLARALVKDAKRGAARKVRGRR